MIQNNYAEWRKSDKRRVHTVWFYLFIFYKYKNYKPISSDIKLIGVCWEMGDDRMERVRMRIFQRAYESLVGDKYVCYIVCDDGFMSVHMCQVYQIIHFNHGQFIICQLYLKKAIVADI